MTDIKKDKNGNYQIVGDTIEASYYPSENKVWLRGGYYQPSETIVLLGQILEELNAKQ